MDASKQSKATYRQKQFGQSSSVSRRNPNKQSPNDMDASKQSKAEDPIDQKETYQQKQFGQSSSVSRRNPNKQPPNDMDASKQSKAEDPIDQKGTYQQKQFGQSSSVSRRNPNKQPPNGMRMNYDYMHANLHINIWYQKVVNKFQTSVFHTQLELPTLGARGEMSN
jgi:hypothetical protein